MLFLSLISLFRNTGKKLTKPAQNTKMKNGITGIIASQSVATQLTTPMTPLTPAFSMQLRLAASKSVTLKNLLRHAQVPMQNTMTAIMQKLDAAISNAPNPRMA